MFSTANAPAGKEWIAWVKANTKAPDYYVSRVQDDLQQVRRLPETSPEQAQVKRESLRRISGAAYAPFYFETKPLFGPSHVVRLQKVRDLVNTFRQDLERRFVGLPKGRPWVAQDPTPGTLRLTAAAVKSTAADGTLQASFLEGLRNVLRLPGNLLGQVYRETGLRSLFWWSLGISFVVVVAVTAATAAGRQFVSSLFR